MFTPYAVASQVEAMTIRRVLTGRELTTQQERATRTRAINKGWLTWQRTEDTVTWTLTAAGGVAVELREVLGADRDLTKAQAGHLARYGLTPSMHRKLVALGLLADDVDATYTEDGAKVRTILIRHGVNF
jgi:hypothetical protein